MTSKSFSSSQSHHDDPHRESRILCAGPALESARAVLILVHGRGGAPEDMEHLFQALGDRDLAARIPAATDNTWYPYSFLAPLEKNQPHLDSALRRLDAVVRELRSQGMPYERLAFLGFSQGACLTGEYVARNPQRYGGVMLLTGGVLGPLGTVRTFSPAGLEGTPTFLGSSDPDPHVPFSRVEETARLFTSMGAEVRLRRYAGMPHTVNDEELDECREILRRIQPGGKRV